MDFVLLCPPQFVGDNCHFSETFLVALLINVIRCWGKRKQVPHPYVLNRVGAGAEPSIFVPTVDTSKVISKSARVSTWCLDLTVHCWWVTSIFSWSHLFPNEVFEAKTDLLIVTCAAGALLIVSAMCGY